jgi:DNA-binding XRE family transcriptional regulator
MVARRSCDAKGRGGAHEVDSMTKPISASAEVLMLANSAADPIDTHIGARVRMRRLRLGMSQAELADALGVTCQQVAQYENGTEGMGAARLYHVAHALQVPLIFFFEQLPVQDGMERLRRSRCRALSQRPLVSH